MINMMYRMLTHDEELNINKYADGITDIQKDLKENNIKCAEVSVYENNELIDCYNYSI